MSGSFSSDPSSTAPHDTRMYDPNVHDNQIVALYETRADAESARQKLLDAGIDNAALRVMDKEADTMAGGVDYDAGDQGLWGSIKSLFVPDEDAHGYRHAIGVGHAMLVVTPSVTANREQIIDLLEATNPLDFDSKLAEWRQSGYDYSAGGTVHTDDNRGVDRTVATPTSVAAPMATGALATGGVAATGQTATTGSTPSDVETIKVMEERLRVGKREVAQGAVRIRSYVVERPVEEQVRLHEERVTIERNPVDRAANAADAAAFQERTIEVRATSEEAVVSKEARVVEEIGIRKDSSDRVETVHDTLRRTEVEVEDSTTPVSGSTGTSTTGTMGTGGSTTNATPGATSSGMNAPRK